MDDSKDSSLMLPEEHEPWDQQPDEPDTAYYAFTIFRGMGPTRKTRPVIERYNEKAVEQISDSTLFTWANVFNWKDRAKQWDKSIEREAREEEKQAQLDMRKRHIKEAQLLQQVGTNRLVQIAKDPKEQEKLHPQIAITMIAEGQRLEERARMGGGKGPTEVKPSFTIIVHNPTISQPSITISQAQEDPQNLSVPIIDVDTIDAEVRDVTNEIQTTDEEA